MAELKVKLVNLSHKFGYLQMQPSNLYQSREKETHQVKSIRIVRIIELRDITTVTMTKVHLKKTYTTCDTYQGIQEYTKIIKFRVVPASLISEPNLLSPRKAKQVTGYINTMVYVD